MSYTNSIRQLAHVFHKKEYQNTDEHEGVYGKLFADENQSEAKNRNNQSQLLHEQGRVTVGDEYGGGIVFYVDGTGIHGLVVAKADMPTLSSDKEEGGFTWCDAKAACTTLESNGYRDWFLPNKEQLNQLYLISSISTSLLLEVLPITITTGVRRSTMRILHGYRTLPMEPTM